MAKQKNPHAVALGRLGGSKTSPRKTAAARKNAKRPRPRRRPDREDLERVSAAIDTLTAYAGWIRGTSLDN